MDMADQYGPNGSGIAWAQYAQHEVVHYDKLFRRWATQNGHGRSVWTKR